MKNIWLYCAIIMINTSILGADSKRGAETKARAETAKVETSVIPNASYFMTHQHNSCFNYIGCGSKSLEPVKCKFHIDVAVGSIVTFHGRDNIVIGTQKFPNLEIRAIAGVARSRLDPSKKPIVNLATIQVDKADRRWFTVVDLTDQHLMSIPLAEEKPTDDDIKMMSEFVQFPGKWTIGQKVAASAR